MALEATPASTASDGRWRIAYSELADDPLSAADLVDDVTYSFTADGFDWQITQDTAEDKRLTMIQNLERPGRKKETLTVTYVASTTAGSADVLFTEGLEGHLTVRRGVDAATAWTAAQKADVITFKAGAKRPNAPVENGVDTISQQLFITSPTVQGASITA